MGERIIILFLVYAHQAIAPGHLSPVKAVNLTLQNPNQLPSLISVYFLAYSNKFDPNKLKLQFEVSEINNILHYPHIIIW